VEPAAVDAMIGAARQRSFAQIEDLRKVR